MSKEPQQFLPFRRGSERRGSAHCAEDGTPAVERRTRTIDWITLFKDADQQAVTDALGECEVLPLPAGTVLLQIGAINHDVYILLSGILSIHFDDDLNPDKAISIFPGECVGELSVIDGKPVSALVLTETDARVVKVGGNVFWQRLMTVPGVAKNLVLTLTSRVRATNIMTLNALREQLELTHLRKELDTARQLQASMLPLERPLFPERSEEIEVCGLMEPASNVGGDLFDCFFVDDNLLFFCIGDVSGHGIAAALFMARTIGLLRILAVNIQQPDKLLETLNERLCKGNETNLFVTLFCGFFNLESGELLYSNGGHCAPMRFANGCVSLLPMPKGPLVGTFPGARFAAMACKLVDNDVLLCYSDGITEANNPDGAEFSEHRCLAILEQAGRLPLPELLDALRREVAVFTGTNKLEDDCTMFAVRRLVAP
ncbi:MAG: PP2C family protein-serine/threonine phosphatase [Burkholderiales bacterium]